MIILFAKTQFSKDIAMLLSIILGISTIILIAIMNTIEKKDNYISVSKTKAPLKKQKIKNKFVNIVVHILAYILFVIYVFPVIIVIIFSFSDITSIITGKLDFSKLTLYNYKFLFTSATAFKPYLVSLVYSGIATVGTVMYASIISKITHKKYTKLAKFYEFSSLIPWLLPSTLISLAFVVTYDAPKWIIFNKVLLGTPWIMILGYIVLQIPFSFRMIRAAFFLWRIHWKRQQSQWEPLHFIHLEK